MFKNVFRITMVICVLAFVGCTGPQKARDMASVLATYTSQLKAQTDQFASSRTDLMKLRTSSLGLLEESALETETQNGFILQTWSLSGGGESAKLVNDLQNLADLTEKQEEANEALKKQYQDEVQNAKSAVNIQGAKLADVQKGLGTLAEKPSLKDQVSFLYQFISDVRSDMQKAGTNAIQNTAAAKTLAIEKANSLSK